MTARNPEAIKSLLTRMRYEWPRLIIPHVRDSKGITPLKLAFERKHRRVVGWLLDHLKDYPHSYCTYQVSKLIG